MGFFAQLFLGCCFSELSLSLLLLGHLLFPVSLFAPSALVVKDLFASQFFCCLLVEIRFLCFPFTSVFSLCCFFFSSALCASSWGFHFLWNGQLCSHLHASQWSLFVECVCSFLPAWLTFCWTFQVEFQASGCAQVEPSAFDLAFLSFLIFCLEVFFLLSLLFSRRDNL